ncbi:3-oxo-5-alpha-steroid 4-dehydrogenase 2a [Ctenopharyngodon idella]|uniref:3-oxo-5-alpha-steroid 4-dehydrogenase 2a n=1 Tax=Ctenopharyngodon idella TaxID=7959 RepID=UPI00222F0E41|nr:3-oxo-5-alpha-steroid 4-dehydrogenase 2a [Ctenopharyngodon idella]
MIHDFPTSPNVSGNPASSFTYLKKNNICRIVQVLHEAGFFKKKGTLQSIEKHNRSSNDLPGKHYSLWQLGFCSRWITLPLAANDHIHAIRTLRGYKISWDYGPSQGRLVYSGASFIPCSCAVVFNNRKFARDRKTFTALDLLLALLSEDLCVLLTDQRQTVSSPHCGVLMFFSGMAINIHSDYILRNLRKPGEVSYKIPRGGMFELVSGANFFGEIIEWCGYAVASWSFPAFSFALFTICSIGPRAYHHHRYYLEKFKDYPKSRKAVIPFLL